MYSYIIYNTSPGKQQEMDVRKFEIFEDKKKKLKN